MKRSDLDKFEKAKGIIFKVDYYKESIRRIDAAIKDCDDSPDIVDIQIRSSDYCTSLNAKEDREMILSLANKVKEYLDNKLNDLNKEFEEL